MICYEIKSGRAEKKKYSRIKGLGDCGAETDTEQGKRGFSILNSVLRTAH